jgi:hypothetical protein
MTVTREQFSRLSKSLQRAALGMLNLSVGEIKTPEQLEDLVFVNERLAEINDTLLEIATRTDEVSLTMVQQRLARAHA